MGTNVKGWCLTGYHSTCPHVSYGRTCGCNCHEFNLTAECERIYNAEGQSAVFEYVSKKHPDVEWLPCEPCETESPISDNACLVCGTPTER